MRNLPTGTVTFLFTDIEGSTKLLHSLGVDGYAQALAEHRRLIREVCSRHDGVEVDTQGDAFFFAFPTAPGALAAAGEMTEALSAGPIQVRIGLHTGTPLLTEEGYVGVDLHRAARIAAAGHGGQVVVSSSTAALLNLELHDLGEHRFKDLGAPERVYQLGDDEFPALKSLYRTNLPIPSTPFLGREGELQEVLLLLTSEDTRLLTLTGPGGTGKTRLALQVAAEASDRYPDGVWWVPLAGLRDPALILSAVAQALDVTEEAAKPLAETMAAALAGKRLLLIVDNIEHLLPPAATEIATLVSVTGPTLLVTSRERLQLQGEQLYPVPTLEVRDGIALFVARARALEPNFEPSNAVEELCTRLDNLPLALELAGARTVVFSPEQLLERLSQRLDLLKGARDADPRQQTLRATIEWSYDLLDEEEQRLLRSLSVFAGGGTYDAAEEVCAADPDTLQSLLDKSLVRRRDSEAGPRYWMLETIREFAAEKLDELGEEGELRRLHGKFFLDLVSFAERALEGSRRAAWVDRLEDDLSNIRAALSAREEAKDGDGIARLATPIVRFWGPSGRFGEERHWYETALALGVHDELLRAKTVGRLGNIDYRQGRYPEALSKADEHLRAVRELGDTDELFYALSWYANTSIALGQSEAASLFEECRVLAQQAGDTWKLAYTVGNLGDLALQERDFERALALSEECATLSREVDDRTLEVVALSNSALAAFHLGRLEDAASWAEQAIGLGRIAHVPVLASCLELLAALAARHGDRERAALLLGAAEAMHTHSGDSPEPAEEALRAETMRLLGALEGELADAWRQGGELSLDEAVECALASID